jgi:hypothetical protein
VCVAAGGEMLIGRDWVEIALIQAEAHSKLCPGRFHPVMLSQKQHLDSIKSGTYLHRHHGQPLPSSFALYSLQAYA